MIRSLYRAALSFSSVSLIPLSYYVKQSGVLAATICYLLCALIFTGLLLYVARYLSVDSIRRGSLAGVKSISWAIALVGLAYILTGVLLEAITDSSALWGVTVAATVAMHASQAFWANPLLLLLGYKFHGVTTRLGTHVVLISREDYKLPSTIEAPLLYRLNNFAFIERVQK